LYTIDDVAARITATTRITVLTGAGVSAASGVPTFRGPDGLWRTFRAEELATPQAFARDPRLVWEWYDWRRSGIAGCRPNSAHDVLARWSHRFSNFTLITQNVDGLHERAGTRDVVRLHGSIWHLRCAAPCRQGARSWRDDATPIGRLPPRCPHCGSLARPDVVWFGEPLDPAIVERAAAAAACDVFFAVGTSAIVHPAAGLIEDAQRSGALTVEINPSATEATGVVDLPLCNTAEIALPKIDQLFDRALR
jgi:NAD-dependent deacetylase